MKTSAPTIPAIPAIPPNQEVRRIKAAMVDGAIAAARNLPELTKNLRAVDPALAQQFAGKTLIASKTPWGTIAITAVAYLSTKYGLGWDQITVLGMPLDQLVAGAGIIVGAYVMRLITNSPIAGIFRRKLP
jgi:hypothetical protein